MKTSREVARDISLRAERVNNVGQVSLRFVLYLLYIKHDQMINIFEKYSSVIHPPGALFTLLERYSTFGE